MQVRTGGLESLLGAVDEYPGDEAAPEAASNLGGSPQPGFQGPGPEAGAAAAAVGAGTGTAAAESSLLGDGLDTAEPLYTGRKSYMVAKWREIQRSGTYQI